LFASGVFRESSSPKPLIIALGSFRIFLKIRGDICKSRCTTGINDTYGKFATGVNEEKKFIYMMTQLLTGVPKKVKNFKLRISPQIFEKI
jgi:hypothetical protein